MRPIYFLFILCFIFFLPAAEAQFIYRESTQLKVNDEEMFLRGISFGNRVWEWSFTEVPSSHHDGEDFRRVRELGMNAIRFYMNYETFEDDDNPYVYKQTGWDWIDQNVEWAKANGIYLILNMHVPQGGFQSQCEGEALWENMENQNRLAALWKAIADRYQDEPQIAAYDLVNEPTPKDSVQQWFTLCQRLVDSVRVVDENHLIVTERAIAVGCDYGFNDGNFNYPTLTEENLMYTVHMYEPYFYTHQLQDWAGTGEGGAYPDESLYAAPGDVTYATGNYSNETLPAGNSDWTRMEGTPFHVDNDTLLLLRTTLLTSNLGEGIAYYDDVTIHEVTSTGEVIRTLLEDDFSGDETVWTWSQNGDLIQSSATDGHEDNFSYTATGTAGLGSITVASLEFPVEQGKYYAIDGWYKGENIPNGAQATITTEFFYSPSGGTITARNKEMLRNQIVDYSAYIEDLGYPVYFGEFGVVRETFENDRGGDNWVRDVIDIFDSLDYHFTYHVWREGAFGLYENDPRVPIDTTSLNVPLQQVFLDFFNGNVTSTHGPKGDSDGYFAFPVPFSQDIKAGGEDVFEIKILGLDGEVLQETRGNQISTRDLPAGTYFIQFINQEGVLLSTKRAVKNE